MSDGADNDLLHELRIERGQRDDHGSRPRWPWAVVIVILVLIILAGGAAYALRDHALTVATSTAVAAASSNDAAVLQATGYVVARRQANVSAQIIDTVTEVLIEEGEHVQKGQVLARLDPKAYQAQLDTATAQYAAAQAQVVKARATLKQDRENARRMNAVVARGYVSKQTTQEANTLVATDVAALDAAVKQAQAANAQVQAAKVNMEYTVIRAPFAGVVTDKSAEVGEIMSPYAAGGGGIAGGIATVVDMDSLEVDVDVNEAYISRVVPGMPVTAVLDAYPDWKIPAHVIAIIPSADKSKATVKVRIALLDKKDPRIIPQMGVRVSFLEKKSANRKSIPGVLVPKSAIVQRGGKNVVFVVADGRAKQTTVTTGADLSDMKQVTQGLNAGAEVVTAPPANLKDGEKVQAKTGGN